jgi:hypothetical protein
MILRAVFLWDAIQISNCIPIAAESPGKPGLLLFLYVYN